MIIKSESTKYIPEYKKMMNLFINEIDKSVSIQNCFMGNRLSSGLYLFIKILAIEEINFSISPFHVMHQTKMQNTNDQ